MIHTQVKKNLQEMALWRNQILKLRNLSCRSNEISLWKLGSTNSYFFLNSKTPRFWLRKYLNPSQMIIFIWEHTENEIFTLRYDAIKIKTNSFALNEWWIRTHDSFLLTHMSYDVDRVMFLPLRTVIIALRVKQVINNDQQLLDRNQWHKQLEIITVPDNKSL